MASQYVKLPKATGGGGGGGAVDSFNGRTGVVISQAGDYSGSLISNTPAGTITATNTQAALNELDSKKQATITGAASTVVSSNLTANRALISNASGKIATTNVSHTELDYVNGVTSPIQTQLDSKQAADADLAAIAALTTTGLIARTGAGTAATRTITAGSAAVSVADGDGVSGNPTVDLPDSGATAGSFGSATQVPVVSVNVKGITTATAQTAIAIPSTQVTNFTTAAQSAAVQNALFPASTVRAPSVDAVTTALAGVLLNPMTTDGDMIYFDSGNQRLPIGAPNQLLRTVSGLPSWTFENYMADFGDCSELNITLTGVLTLTAPMYANVLTIDVGGQLITAGFPVYCKVLNLENAAANSITRRGNNGNNGLNSGTGQAGGIALSSAMLGGSGAGGAGATGATNAGASSGVATNVTTSNGGGGGQSGASGAGGTGASAAGAAGASASIPTKFGRFEQNFLRGVTLVSGGAGGRGGNSGGGDGANASRGGAGAGGGGGVMAVYAETVITGPSTPAGVINAGGGDGGSQANSQTVGSVGGSTGGGGGGGGYIYFVYARKIGAPVIGLLTAKGGNGGNSANGFGTGIGGAGAGGGAGGRIQVINYETGIGFETIGLVGAAGTPAVGITGGHGGQGGACEVTL